MSIDFGRNSNDGISVNPPRTIISMRPQITITRQGIFFIFNSVKRTLDITYRSAPWHGAAKSEGENLGGNNIFKNAERENDFEVENVQRKNYVILNQVDLNHINIDLNHFNHANSYHANYNQLLTSNLTTVNDSSNIFALNKTMSWYEDLTHAVASTVFTRTTLAYVPSKHTAHTPSLAH